MKRNGMIGLVRMVIVGVSLTALQANSAFAQWAGCPAPNVCTETTTASVGVDTTIPQAPLHIQTSATTKGKELLRLDNTSQDGIANGTSIFFGQSGIQYGRIANFYSADTNWILSLGHSGTADDLVINRFGNIGIGTTNPQAPLHVQTSVAAKAKELLRLDNIAGDAVNNGTSIFFGQAGVQYGRIANYYSTANNWILSLGHNGTADDLVITQSGKIGIGTSAPAYTLDVNGTIHGTNVIATYQDVAEWVPASEPMAPGTVVVVDSRTRNGVAPSTHAYDTAVAGVVSEHPGVSLGVPGESKAQIATTGRVKVRVDASGGAINAGDLLVTSDRPGVAKRSEPVHVAGVKMHRPGTLIGKALEPLPSGEGEILVLLSLQ
jgi:hypothetical protein